MKTDLLIVGAGMAGLALASALAGRDVKVVLLDPDAPAAPDQWPPQFDPRVSALTRASENILTALGAWPLMKNHRINPFYHMDVWDSDGTGNIQFHAQDAGEETLGHIVENRVTTHALWQTVCAAPNIEYRPLGLERILEQERSLQQDGGAGWRVVLSDGSDISPSLLVGADGARSRVRDQLGFRCRTWDYGQQAIVTTVTTEKPHGGVARQVFLESGPLAFLPLSEDACSIVWSLDKAAVEPVAALSDEDFRAALTSAFEHRLGEVLTVDQRHRFPLIQNHAVNYVLPGVALIGDAAHSIHPLAGQGINLGFLDAAVLAEEIGRALDGELPLNEFSILRRYQRRRKPHNLMMMTAMEGFRYLFGSDIPPLRVARNLGLNLFNRHRHLKNAIMSRAMGVQGDLPDLALPGLIADF